MSDWLIGHLYQLTPLATLLGIILLWLALRIENRMAGAIAGASGLLLSFAILVWWLVPLENNALFYLHAGNLFSTPHAHIVVHVQVEVLP